MKTGASRVAVVRVTARVWREFRVGWRRLPEAAWRRWWRTMLPGLLLCEGLVALLTWGVWRSQPDGPAAWEVAGLRAVAQFRLIDIQRAVFLEPLGGTPFLAVLIVVAIAHESRAGRPLRALALPAGFLGSKLLTTTGWLMWSRARPQLILGGVLEPPVHSFPSGHAAQSIVIYGLLTWLWVTASRSRIEQTTAWLLAAILVGLISEARLRIGAHWPSDVLAGLLIGAAWLIVLLRALPRQRGVPPQG